MSAGVSTSCLYTLLVIWLYIAGICGTCIFDKLQPENVTVSQIQYDNGDTNSKQKRSTARPFEPIRINVDYHDLGYVLTDSQQHLLKDIVSKTVAKAEKIFSVQRVVGNLLLSRSSAACVFLVQTGINADKCAGVKANYKGEVCIDSFLIPDEHIEGLEIYNEDDVDPVVVKEPGEGLPDTDFVLYVRSLNTETCIEGNQRTIAYATYCQLDQKNRPIAGYINFCPDLLQEETYSPQKVFVTALHELFHSLGFSNQLFDKFQDCYSSGSCFDRQDTVQEVLGEQRIVTPKVVEVTSAHFNCKTHETVNEFGPMLEVEESTGKVNSHWDAAFMFSSIMTPSIGLPDLTKVDPITLALFEDTGWYKVDYSQADSYPWGISGGCDWGRDPQCQTELDEDCFCSVPGERKCHYLHRSKGTCKTDQYLHNCYVYKTTKTDSCVLSENNPVSAVAALTGELYAENSRCFEANLTTKSLDWQDGTVSEGMIEGRCYQTRCNGTAAEVKVGDSPWMKCENETVLTVPGYKGVLNCPHSGLLCPPEGSEEPYPEPEPHLPPRTTPNTPARETTTSDRATPTNFIPDSNLDVICIELVFASVDYDQLVARRLDVAFKEACLSKVWVLTGVKRRRISSVHLLSGTLFRFDLLPAQYPGDGPRTAKVVSILKSSVSSGNFSIQLSTDGPVYVANGLNQMDGGPQVSMDQTPKGVIAAMVVGSVVAAVIIGLAVLFVQRYYTIHSQVRRPQTPPPAQMSPSSPTTTHQQQPEGNPNQRRLSHDSGRRSVNSSRSGNNSALAGVIRTSTTGSQMPQAGQTSGSNRERHPHRLNSPNSNSGQRDRSLPGSRQSRSPVERHPSNSHMHTDVTRLSINRTTPEQQQSPVDHSLMRRFPLPLSSTDQQDDSFLNESPLSHRSMSAQRDNTRRSKKDCSGKSEIPLAIRNSAARASQQSHKKPCLLQCKCAWLKGRLRSSTNKRREGPDKAGKSPQSKVQSDKPTGKEEKPYFPSVVYCSPISVRKDYNANIYPKSISPEDVVIEPPGHINPAASIRTNSNSSDEIPFSGAANNATIYDTNDASSSGFQPNHFKISMPEEQNIQGTHPSSRISHYSSCNSFNDTESKPTHKTRIDLSYSNHPSRPNALPQPGRTKPSISDSCQDCAIYQAHSTLSHPNSYLASSGSSSIYPKSSILTPGPSSIGSGSVHVKPPGSVFTVNGSHVDLDLSQSTLGTEHSGSVARAPIDTDVSYLASRVQLTGHRNSNNSWKSFSSDTSIGSSAIRPKV